MKGSDVNAAYKDGWTALHLVVDKGFNLTVRLLIDKGADVNALGSLEREVAVMGDSEAVSVAARRFRLDVGIASL